ncbi:MAG: Lpg1974 family pore-forming outer membrane protein [Waddliaceae bacterium]
MQKWSLKRALALFGAWLCLFLPSSAKAGGYGNDACGNPYCCCNPCLCGRFEIGGEFIWWKPCLDHLEYAVVDFDPSDPEPRRAKYQTLCPDWEPGGRAWIYSPSLFCGSCGLYASYTGICSKDSDTTRVDPANQDKRIVIPLAGFEGLDDFNRVNAHWKVHYHDYDVLFTYVCSCGDCSVFRPFFGFAGLVLDQELFVKGRELGTQQQVFNGVNVKWNSDLYAYGIRVGTEYECQLADCLSLFGKFAASVLTGEPDTKNFQKAFLVTTEGRVEERLKVAENECYRAYPGYHLSAGAIYSNCLCNVDFSVRIGYEFVEWHNLPHHRRFIDNNPTQGTGSTDRTFGWQGLLAGASIGF